MNAAAGTFTKLWKSLFWTRVAASLLDKYWQRRILDHYTTAAQLIVVKKSWLINLLLLTEKKMWPHRDFHQTFSWLSGLKARYIWSNFEKVWIWTRDHCLSKTCMQYCHIRAALHQTKLWGLSKLLNQVSAIEQQSCEMHYERQIVIGRLSYGA